MVLSDEAIQFSEQFEEITRNPMYLELKAVPRHGSTNTYDHSVRVAYLAYRLAKKFGLDSVSAARIGFLHDFCLIDYHKEDKAVHNGRWYCFYHPEDALVNSKAEGYQLSATEEKAIASHMFPLSTSIPTSRLGYILTLSDKTVAAYESYANVVEAYDKLRLIASGLRVRVVRAMPGRRRLDQ